MKTRKWIALGISSLMVLPLAACSGDSGKTNESAPATEENKDNAAATEVQDVTLKVWTPQEDQSDDYGNWLGKMETAFQEAHPEYKITWTNEVCQEGDIGDKVTQDPANSADVFLFANDQIGKLLDANAISELGGPTLEAIKADNSQAVLDTVTMNDAVYGVPFTTNTWFMYYNKSLVSEDEIGSLDKMLEHAKVTFPLANSWYIPAFYYADGGTMFGDNGQDAAAGVQFNLPKVTEYLVNLVANPNFKNDADGSGYAAFSSGDAAVMFSGSWDYNNLSDALGDNLGAAQLPTADIDGAKQLKSFSGSKAIGVNPHCKTPAAAVAFAAFLGSEEAQKSHWELRAVIPTNTKLLQDAEIGDNPLVKAQNATIDNTSVVQPYITAMGNYWTIGENFGKAIVNGDVTAENAVEQTQKFQDQLDTLK